MALTTSASFASASCFSSTFIGTSIVLNTIPEAFPSCNAVASVYTGCNTKTGSDLDRCVCNQDLFNDIYGCWGEWRRCQGSGGGDHNAQSVLSNWHAKCDGIATVTTPALPTLPASVSQCPAQVREQYQSACTQGVKAANACIAKYPSKKQSALYSSCTCQSSVLSWASLCMYDAGKTCQGRTLTLSDIAVWKDCPTQAASLIAQHSSSATESDYTYSATGLSSAATASATSSLPTSTGSSTMAGSTASSTSGGSTICRMFIKPVILLLTPLVALLDL